MFLPQFGPRPDWDGVGGSNRFGQRMSNILPVSPIVDVMSNPWVDNVLRSAKDTPVRPAVPVAEQIGVGGPIPVAAEACEDLPCISAFYDQENDTLSVHILPFEPYYSFLESDEVRIDTDEQGRPVFIEVTCPRNEWRIEPDFSVPADDMGGALRFRETRRRFSPGGIYTDRRRENVCLRFLARPGLQVVRLAKNLLAETAEGFLVALWVLGVELDFAGRKQTKWRAATAAALRRKGRQWQSCTRGELSENSPER